MAEGISTALLSIVELLVTILPENPEVVECELFVPLPFVVAKMGGVFRHGVLSSLVTSMLSSV
jgi:hypothetical protein